MITLISVPYDSGNSSRRMGAGPLRLVEGGVVARLEQSGQSVRHVPIELPDQLWAEVAAARRIQQLVARVVSEALSRGERPIILSGNCNTSTGTVAGIGADHVGVVWLDAHPDLETPDTTESGFFDGQALAMLTGRCWRQIARTVPGFSPVPDERVLFVGGRDASDAERSTLRSYAWLREDALGDLSLLDALAKRVRKIYLHVDLDIHGAESLRANTYASVGGPTPADVHRFLGEVARRFEIVASAITAFDPGADDDGRGFAAAVDLVELLAQIMGPPGARSG
jgi:arginase